jgi:hypothetical protein
MSNLKNQETIVVQIDAAISEQLSHFFECNLTVVNVVIRRVVLVGRSFDSEVRVRYDFKFAWALFFYTCVKIYC